jgi:hypothetical protein
MWPILLPICLLHCQQPSVWWFDGSYRKLQTNNANWTIGSKLRDEIELDDQLCNEKQESNRKTWRKMQRKKKNFML